MLYRCIYADPPWMERGGGKIVRGANRHYTLMRTKDIMRLDVQSLCDPKGCHLYLWVTNGKLPDGLKVMDAWGFRYVTVVTWCKDRMGIGQYFRGQTEQCLFGTMGKLPYRFLSNGKRAQSTTRLDAPRRKHSQKPEEMRSRIEKVSVGPYLELFARERRPGWSSWGNEVGSDVELKLREDTKD